MKSNKKKRIIKILAVILAVIAIIIGGCVIYLSDYYRADNEAVEAFMQGKAVPVEKDGMIVFEPENAVKGFIFYPGGKVEYTAYIPLMQSLCENGILCVLVEMPFNLAVFDINAAEGIPEKYPYIEDWFIGGHSLGGAMAASYISGNIEDYEGLVLLGAYSTSDLSQTDLRVLSVYGSEDEVMDHDKYAKNKSNLPADLTEIIINGGCHAYFGMYGMQDGDGNPSVTNEEQIKLTAEHIYSMIEGN